MAHPLKAWDLGIQLLDRVANVNAKRRFPSLGHVRGAPKFFLTVYLILAGISAVRLFTAQSGTDRWLSAISGVFFVVVSALIILNPRRFDRSS